MLKKKVDFSSEVVKLLMELLQMWINSAEFQMHWSFETTRLQLHNMFPSVSGMVPF